MDDLTPNALEPKTRRLTLAKFQGLAQLPPEITWFANTKRTCEKDVKDFSR